MTSTFAVPRCAASGQKPIGIHTGDEPARYVSHPESTPVRRDRGLAQRAPGPAVLAVGTSRFPDLFLDIIRLGRVARRLDLRHDLGAIDVEVWVFADTVRAHPL